MKDLRTPEEIDLDEKNINLESSTLFFSKLYDLLLVIMKYIHFLFMYKYHILFLFFITAMIFPETIGYYISFVINSFIKGYKNFK